MSSLTKVSSMPKCFPSGLSLPGQCRIGTQRLAARHTYGWGANSPSEPKFSSLPARTSTRPPPLRYPNCWRRAHSQGEGPKGLRHPDTSRPSPCTLSVQPSRSRYPVQQRWAHSQGGAKGAAKPIGRPPLSPALILSSHTRFDTQRMRAGQHSQGKPELHRCPTGKRSPETPRVPPQGTLH